MQNILLIFVIGNPDWAYHCQVSLDITLMVSSY